MAIPRIVFPILFTASALMLSACISHKRTTSKSTIDFRSFFLVTNGAEFPSQGNIDICMENQTLTCNDIVNTVLLAKDQLLSLPHKEALDALLEELSSTCDMNKWQRNNDFESRCSGAFTAIYYFNSVSDDKLIIDSLLSMDRQSLQNLMRARRAWVYNRTNKEPWIDFATNALEEPPRELFLERLNNERPDVIGLQLLEQE